MSDLRTKKVVSQLVGNGRSMRGAMIEAGYSENYANQPSKFRKNKEFQDLIDPLIRQLDEQIQADLKALTKKRGKAKFGEISSNIDRMISKRELLSGKATSRVDDGMGKLLSELENLNETRPKTSRQELEDQPSIHNSD
jgi:DNA-binding cell septation regulator SpoVG